jgi:hypothetical protein
MVPTIIARVYTMQNKLIFFVALALSCTTTTKDPTKDTKTPNLGVDPKSTTTVPTPTPTPASWPPAGYQLMAKPMENPGTPGWVELPSLAKHKAMEAVAPQKPLLNGMFDDKGMFYTDGKVDGGTLVKECKSETYLNITNLTSSPTLPTPAPGTILLYLCEGKDPVEGKEGLLVPK